ncbi:hypothetical protein EYF88_05315 [Paracoccus sediminis]|uniref:Cysteine rich repeat-containing protein n=1 Tax=Paracoccus sediminis TaxID=1214787 RepID=A0ABY1YNV7_9RHOB|nr:hypothetical protein [Paracoccus sediminis]TBN52303.1 hypothetical protein EYF88_05315 [Paracoccus sediminis]
MKSIISLLLLLLFAQESYAAWNIQQCAANIKDRHGIRIEDAMKICAGSQARQKARRQCVIEKVKNQDMTPESALSACVNDSR